jgi:hypothetical protein
VWLILLLKFPLVSKVPEGFKDSYRITVVQPLFSAFQFPCFFSVSPMKALFTIDVFYILGSMSGANAPYGMAPWSSLNILCMKIEPGIWGINVLGSHISYIFDIALQTS